MATGSVSGLPQPGMPRVEWVKGRWLACWTFATADEAEQLREFAYWCGWFGFDECDRPEKIEGNVWLVRSRTNQNE